MLQSTTVLGPLLCVWDLECAPDGKGGRGVCGGGPSEEQAGDWEHICKAGHTRCGLFLLCSEIKKQSHSHIQLSGCQYLGAQICASGVFI